MTWIEFKTKVESAGVLAEDEISWIDVGISYNSSEDIVVKIHNDEDKSRYFTVM